MRCIYEREGKGIANLNMVGSFLGLEIRHAVFLFVFFGGGAYIVDHIFSIGTPHPESRMLLPVN